MRTFVVAACLLAACVPYGDDDGVDVLGGLTHDPSQVTITGIADASDGLADPHDLAFDADVRDRLWIVNQEDDSVTVLSHANGAVESSRHLVDPDAEHFMDE